MYSFYGGRPGNAFIVVASFESIGQMVDNFKKGPNYNDVHYDEYVLISNENNKDSGDNGKIFRRGYDFSNTMGGAEYIGCIVGPSGNAPHLELKTYNGVKDIAQSHGVLNENGEVLENHALAYRYTETESALNNNTLVPGKDGNTFNDKIKWNSFSIREQNGTIATAFIGFTIPYPVFDFEINTIDYWENSNVVKDETAGNHPFYNKWNINIPKGQKGDSFGNFRIITSREDINNVSTDPDIYTAQDRNQDALNNRAILVYDYITHNPNNSSDDEPEQRKTLYIGDYNSISDIKLKQDGVLTVTYTHEKEKDINAYDSNDANAVDSRIRWIKGLSLNTEGILTLTYNTSETENLDSSIEWIIGAELADDGTLFLNYNTGAKRIVKDADDSTEDKKDAHLKWIDDIVVSDSGYLQVKYNTSEDYQPVKYKNNNDSAYYDAETETYLPRPVMIKFIKSIELTDGLFKVTYNDQSFDTLNPKEIDGTDIPLKWITYASYSEGRLYFNYNTSDSQVFDLNPPVAINMRTRIVNEDSDNEYSQEVLSIDYAHQTTAQTQTDFVINSVNKMTLSDDGHLLVQYTDGSKNNRTLITTTISPSGETPPSEDKWADLGLIDLNIFKFDNEQAFVQNKAVFGVLSKDPDQDTINLEFDLTPSQFISKAITEAYIREIELNFDYLNTKYHIKQYNTSIGTVILNSPFGVKIKIYNIPEFLLEGENITFNETEDVLVNILIKHLKITFDVEDTSESTSLDQDSIKRLENQITNFNSSLQELNTIVESINGENGSISNLNTKIDTLDGTVANISSSVAANLSLHKIANVRKTTFKLEPESTTIVGGNNAIVLNEYLDRSEYTDDKTNKAYGVSRLGMNPKVANQYYGIFIPETASQQKNGFLLEFSNYNVNEKRVIGNGYQWFFIPKVFKNGQNVYALLSKPAEGVFGGKAIKLFTKKDIKGYAEATLIAGTKENTETSKNGLFHNGEFALTGVYGV